MFNMNIDDELHSTGTLRRSFTSGMYHLKSFGTQSDVATSQTLTLSLSDLNAVQSGISPATSFS